MESFFDNKIRRVLIKISGEALADNNSFGLGTIRIVKIASDIVALHAKGVQVCVVVGGGNILRGASLAESGFMRTTADYMGMIATIINALALQNAIEKFNVQCRVMSSITATAVCEPYIKRRATRHIDKNRIVIFAGGTGNPYFSTDTAAVLRSIEMDCAVIVKCTHVDGVYSTDPKKDQSAIRYNEITYSDLLARNLKVMDASAIALARDNMMPIIVCNLDNLSDVVDGSKLYTLIKN